MRRHRDRRAACRGRRPPLRRVTDAVAVGVGVELVGLTVAVGVAFTFVRVEDGIAVGVTRLRRAAADDVVVGACIACGRSERQRGEETDQQGRAEQCGTSQGKRRRTGNLQR